MYALSVHLTLPSRTWESESYIDDTETLGISGNHFVIKLIHIKLLTPYYPNVKTWWPYNARNGVYVLPLSLAVVLTHFNKIFLSLTIVVATGRFGKIDFFDNFLDDKFLQSIAIKLHSLWQYISTLAHFLQCNDMTVRSVGYIDNPSTLFPYCCAGYHLRVQCP